MDNLNERETGRETDVSSHFTPEDRRLLSLGSSHFEEEKTRNYVLSLEARRDAAALYLLQRASDLQAQFWESVGELETLLDIDIDSTLDIADQTIDSLLGVDEDDDA